MTDEELKEVTTEELLMLICNRAHEILNEEKLAFFRQNQVIEETDTINYKKTVERSAAARVLHMYLKKVLNEADEYDVSLAERDLADLYDCRVCANHIAQIYVKGIMSEEYTIEFIGKKAFGIHSTISYEEAEIIAGRLFNKAERIRIYSAQK